MMQTTQATISSRRTASRPVDQVYWQADGDYVTLNIDALSRRAYLSAASIRFSRWDATRLVGDLYRLLGWRVMTVPSAEARSHCSVAAGRHLDALSYEDLRATAQAMLVDAPSELLNTWFGTEVTEQMATLSEADVIEARERVRALGDNDLMP